MQDINELSSDIVLTADVHLGDGEQRRGVFIDLLTRYRERPVVVMGDLFSYWYERWGRVPSRYMPLLDDIVKLDRSAPIFLIPGNRDLLAGKTLTKLTQGGIVVTGDVVPLPKRGVVLAHGDLLTRWDGRYRLYRFLLTSGLMSLVARMVPEFIAEKVVFGLKSASAAGKRSRGKHLLGLELSVAEKLIDGDIEGLICGHFHPEHLITYRGLKRWISILPDWGSAPGSHAVLTEAGAFNYHPTL